MSQRPANIEKTILWRSYFIFLLILLFGVSIVAKTFIIQYYEGDALRKKFQELTVDIKNIEAVRGNIYANDGSLLATSVPIYDIYLDTKTKGFENKIFNKNIDSLSICLANLFKDKLPSEYKKEIIKAKKNGERYWPLKRNIRYQELRKMKSFPIFRMGKYKAGFIYIQQNKREKPFYSLAARTIGYYIPTQKVGLEAGYDEDLKGAGGKRLMKKISGGVWMPINDNNEVDPKDGNDLYTSIDINLQDVAQHALLKQLTEHNADHGCVVLMEVETGDIKAISNLSRNTDGSYSENYNYAIGESTEPGSTFKLASLMAAMEDGFIDLDDSIQTGKGIAFFHGQQMKDSHEGGHGKITVKRVLELSSNIGVAKVITQNYGANPQKFIDRIKKMGLGTPLKLEIPGEGRPYIKDVKDKSWSALSLPWISHGYEISLTPLQILTFYNAVANNGVMVRPRFVKMIKSKGQMIKEIPVTVLNEAICSAPTIEKAKKMLEGVVSSGTAKNLSNSTYKIAGKTGTAQIANSRYGYKYESQVSYQASFVGYFPADKPKYSCIVVVNAPSNNVYYGNLVAGPIFKEVADKIYATSIEIHEPLALKSKSFSPKNGMATKGNMEDIQTISTFMNIPYQAEAKEGWFSLQADSASNNIKTKAWKIPQNIVPNVVGMTLKDAIYLLENMGVHVVFEGKGKIQTQSILPGTKITKGQTIVLSLNI